jgi:hypothetical protein
LAAQSARASKLLKPRQQLKLLPLQRLHRQLKLLLHRLKAQQKLRQLK